MTGLLRWGYIKKQGSSRKTWKKRWFVLSAGFEGQEAKLQYFNSQKDTAVLGTIEITEKTKVKQTADDRFEISTPQRIYFLITSTEQDCTEWVDILNYLIGEKTQETSLEDAPMLQFRGYLATQVGLLKMYKQMYYVLDARRICYYTDHSKTEPLGAINLQDCTEVGLMHNGCFALVVSGKVKYLYSKNLRVLDDWVAVINNALDYNRKSKKMPPPLKQRGASLAATSSSTSLAPAPPAPERTTSKPVKTSRRKIYSEEDDIPYVEPASESGEPSAVTVETSEPAAPEEGTESHTEVTEAQEVRSSHASEADCEEDNQSHAASEVQNGDITFSMYEDDEEDGDSDGEVIPDIPPPLPPIPVGRILSMVDQETVPPSPFVEVAGEMSNFFLQEPDFPWLVPGSQWVPENPGEEQPPGDEGQQEMEPNIDDIPVQVPESVRQNIYLDRLAMKSYSENLNQLALEDPSEEVTEPEPELEPEPETKAQSADAPPPVPILLSPPVPAPRIKKPAAPKPEDPGVTAEANTNNNTEQPLEAPIPAPRPAKPMLRVPSIRAIASDRQHRRPGPKPAIPPKPMVVPPKKE